MFPRGYIETSPAGLRIVERKKPKCGLSFILAVCYSISTPLYGKYDQCGRPMRVLITVVAG